MSEQPMFDTAWVDIRHCTPSENVACGAKGCTTRWAKYVLETSFNPNTMRIGRSRTFLCKEHATRFLVLSDALALD